MPKVTVQTGHPHDGTYDLDLTSFTWRERAYITEQSGTLPPEFSAKWFGEDPLTVIATIAVMMQRADVLPDLDALLDADHQGTVTLDYSDLKVPEADPTPRPSDDDETVVSNAD